jgi:hypothetical protein
MFKKIIRLKTLILALILSFLASCATPTVTYYDPTMDFSAIKTVAVMPFANLTTDKLAAARVRDVFSNTLLSTGAVYVLPSGEVARGVLRTGVADSTAPSEEEIVKLAAILKVDAVITGVVKEYGTVRSGTTSANIISFSLQMIEVQSGKVIWSASSTKGGISVWDRFFGGGGKAMNSVTEEAVNDVIDKLFQ